MLEKLLSVALSGIFGQIRGQDRLLAVRGRRTEQGDRPQQSERHGLDFPGALVVDGNIQPDLLSGDPIRSRQLDADLNLPLVAGQGPSQALFRVYFGCSCAAVEDEPRLDVGVDGAWSVKVRDGPLFGLGRVQLDGTDKAEVQRPEIRWLSSYGRKRRTHPTTTYRTPECTLPDHPPLAPPPKGNLTENGMICTPSLANLRSTHDQYSDTTRASTIPSCA